MFALLFDRKSGVLTLLTVGTVGALLFAAGLVVGVRMSWDKLASHLPHEEAPTPLAPPGAFSPSTSAPAAGDAASRLSRPQAPAPLAPAPLAGTEPASFSRRTPAGPPADWVPLSDGAPWPGATESHGNAASDLQDETAETPEPAAGVTRYYVQAGTFSDETAAEEMRASLRPLCRGKSWQPFVESILDRYGRHTVAVRIGPFASEAAAQDVSNGLNGSLVRRTAGRRT